MDTAVVYRRANLEKPEGTSPIASHSIEETRELETYAYRGWKVNKARKV